MTINLIDSLSPLSMSSTAASTALIAGVTVATPVLDLDLGLGLGLPRSGLTPGGATTSPVSGIGIGVGAATPVADPGATASPALGVGGLIIVGPIGVGVGIGVGGGGTGGGGTGGGGTGGGGTGGGGTGAPSAGTPDPHTAFANIFRLANVSQIPAQVDAQLDVLDQQIANGQITARQAVLQIVTAATGFTAVAETSYQFFTGLTPTAGGLTYLVNSPGNTTDLSDTYYDPFNLENRYINFASNLGLHSDFAPQFAGVFGAMSFEGAVATAYDRIVGRGSAQAAGINADAAIADIASRRPYFEAVAQERFAGDDFGLSTKLAAIAYLMQEAVRANIGNYGEANQNFLFDLADGDARFNIDLVGVYGPGTPLDVIA